MTSLANLLSPQSMHSLGWALLHFFWQGTAVAAVAAAAMAMSGSAAVRYRIGVSALALMLAAPVATFLAGLQDKHPQSHVSYVAAAAPDSDSGMPSIPQRNSSSPDAFLWLVEVWLAGVVALSLRSAGGFLLIERERRRRFATLTGRVLEICVDLQHRLGITRAIRYCECARLQSPAVLGWFRPAVMLPVSALTGLSPDQLRSVIAHELAHIKRLDAFVNIFQIGVETLLFYHPAVWWLNRRIRSEREHCCDDIAVSICGNPLQYARALTLMEQWRGVPAMAMAAAGGSLSARVRRLLGMKSGTSVRGAGLTASVVCLTTAMLAGNAFLNAAHPRTDVHAAVRAAVPAIVALPIQSASSPEPVAKPSPPQHAEKDETPVSGTSYIDGLKAAGLTGLTADQLIALKIQDVTPDYIRGLKQLGLHPDVDEIISFRVQGITPEYIQGLRALGLDADGSRIIGLKVQDVTPEYFRGLKEAGLNPDVDRLIGLKVQGVTPEYVRELKAAGINADADKIIALKVQDVTPEYVQSIRALGLNPGADQIISMKVQDVTADYIKALQSAGFKASIDDIISAKVQDLTPEFIERARKHGFQSLTLEKLLELKRVGVLDGQADI
ncbi:MAG TPA: M56 family metallopeptidase [Candidatus Sulfotelmatobacter sp.]